MVFNTEDESHSNQEDLYMFKKAPLYHEAESSYRYANRLALYVSLSLTSNVKIDTFSKSTFIIF